MCAGSAFVIAHAIFWQVNLQEQGRLIRQDQFLVWQGRKKSLRHVFLFEELVLFSKTKRGRQGGHDIYLYKRSFKVHIFIHVISINFKLNTICAGEFEIN